MSRDEIAAIASRHKLDAIFFDAGHHDANGYVVMAHKDRGELLARLRALRSGELKGAVGPQPRVPAKLVDCIAAAAKRAIENSETACVMPSNAEGELAREVAFEVLRSLPDAGGETGDTIVIPKAAFNWLLGEGVDHLGRHFGEGLTGEVPAYWWRSVFRQMCGDAEKGGVA